MIVVEGDGMGKEGPWKGETGDGELGRAVGDRGAGSWVIVVKGHGPWVKIERMNQVGPWKSLEGKQEMGNLEGLWETGVQGRG